MLDAKEEGDDAYHRVDFQVERGLSASYLSALIIALLPANQPNDAPRVPSW
jgi:hypothetical protein